MFFLGPKCGLYFETAYRRMNTTAILGIISVQECPRSRHRQDRQNANLSALCDKVGSLVFHSIKTSASLRATGHYGRMFDDLEEWRVCTRERRVRAFGLSGRSGPFVRTLSDTCPDTRLTDRLMLSGHCPSFVRTLSDSFGCRIRKIAKILSKCEGLLSLRIEQIEH